MNGVEIIRCGCIAKIRSQSISLTYAQELDKLMDGFRPDIVIIHYPNLFVANLLLRYAQKEFKLIIYWHLDIAKQKFLRILFNKQNLKLIDRADKIVVATPKHVDASAYSGYFGDKKLIVPYAIDEQSLVISDEEIAWALAIKEKYRNKVIGFFIGRHVPYKGLKIMDKFFDNVKAIQKANVSFTIELMAYDGIENEIASGFRLCGT